MRNQAQTRQNAVCENGPPFAALDPPKGRVICDRSFYASSSKSPGTEADETCLAKQSPFAPSRVSRKALAAGSSEPTGGWRLASQAGG
jgi:hypothetical protein